MERRATRAGLGRAGTRRGLIDFEAARRAARGDAQTAFAGIDVSTDPVVGRHVSRAQWPMADAVFGTGGRRSGGNLAVDRHRDSVQVPWSSTWMDAGAAADPEADQEGTRASPSIDGEADFAVGRCALRRDRDVAERPVGSHCGRSRGDLGEYSAVPSIGLSRIEGRCTLLALLRAKRIVERLPMPRRLTAQRILTWADAHHARTGRWPRARPDPIPESPEENWRNVSEALYVGTRGLPGGSSLSQLLAEQRGVPDRFRRQGLSYSRILQWADQFHARTGRWPTSRCGPVAEAPGETWGGIDYALLEGCRGLPGGARWRYC